MSNYTIIDVAEAVVITAALNEYMNTLSEKYSHSTTEYQAAQQFMTVVYKKYHRIAQTKVDQDMLGNFVIRRDIKRDFDFN